MRNIRTLAAATYGDITRRPLYYILLFTFVVAIFGSKFLTLFSFYREIHMVREMGMATITFWGFLIVVVTSGLIVGQELEDRTAVTLLSKPIQRVDFLLGKFFGLVASLIPGMIVLAGVLFLTLWMMSLPKLPLHDADLAREVQQGASPFGATLRITWKMFFLSQSAVVVEGTLLSFFQTCILAAAAVSFSAFFPNVVSVAATTLVFILGNVSSYMVASVENLKVGPLSFLGRAGSYLIPNLGYFNLQMYFSEGKIISPWYLTLSFAYTALYVVAVFIVSCALFRKREVR
jgi:ABC-type transport system involved in multi-copper enzyme maturation permease subunit